MSGKTRAPMKKDGRGGPRPGAGRLPAVKEQERLDQILKDIRKWEAQEGRTINDELLRMFFSKKGVRTREKIKIAQHLNSLTVPTQTKVNVEEKPKFRGPTIYREGENGEMIIVQQGNSKIFLPELKPDPAKLLAAGGEKNTEE